MDPQDPVPADQPMGMREEQEHRRRSFAEVEELAAYATSREEMAESWRRGFAAGRRKRKKKKLRGLPGETQWEDGRVTVNLPVAYVMRRDAMAMAVSARLIRVPPSDRGVSDLELLVEAAWTIHGFLTTEVDSDGNPKPEEVP